MTSNVKWIQLSDLHIGSEFSKWTDSTLREKFTKILNEDIKNLDFILITGDIIHRGEYNNLDNVNNAKEFLDDLKTICDRIIICPGNHDYIRNKSRFTLLNQWKEENNESKIQQQEYYARKLRTDFSDYEILINNSFGENFDSQIKSHVATIDNAINIVVLNTSVFSGQPIGTDFQNLEEVKVNDSNKIWLSEYELPKINNIKDGYPTIVIGHHPLQMFDEHPRNMIINFLKSVNTKYYFCGHIHQIEDAKFDNIEQIATSGLFKDDYNCPSFLFHSMDKSANEHIDTKIFKFENGKWKSTDYKNHENNNFDTYHLAEEKSSMDEITGKVINSSSISDGAMRFKYNNGFFNLYITKAKTSDYITPHLHKEMDEITYVSNGELFAYIDNDFFLVKKDSAILMPKSKLHSLIPISYPCDYITMGVEEGKNSNYESIWSEDINEIINLETKLENCEPSQIGTLCDEIIKYLNSSILEVRWQAIDTLKRIMIPENETSTVCSSSIQSMISKMLLQSCDEKKLFGIEMASEFRSIIRKTTIEQLLTSKSNFMISWNCAYYLLNLKSKSEFPKINLVSIFNKININKVSDLNDRCNYYEKAIIALLRLMVDRKSDLLEEIYYDDNYTVFRKNCMPLDDIIIHFVLWYTSFKYPLEQVNYTLANNRLMEYNISDESILRSLLDINDYMERYKVLSKCKNEKKILEVSKAYFESIENVYSDSSLNSLKNSISKYLRIIVSEKCNLNCSYCHHEGRISSLIGNNINNNSDFDIRTLLNEAKKCGFEKIKISGGEPLLYPNILEECNEFQNQFKDIGFTSNGTQIIKLKSNFERIKGSKLKFNITLNSLNPQKYKEITGQNCLEDVKKGIDFLIDNGFSIKINSVITSYNFDDIVDLINYAARKRVDIKFLDLFSIDGAPEKFQPISIAEIKAKIQDLFKLTDDDFSLVDDYMSTNVMGIKVLIPKRIYSVDCIYNCTKYPCAEGLFGIRVYEDYSCAQCFNKEVLSGGIQKFSSNIDRIRDGFNKMSFSL
ncbi:MAG: metallophosphoesterase [Eubacterium sp.]|nr:metallophosphoesterase [Eubacterium sp.]